MKLSHIAISILLTTSIVNQSQAVKYKPSNLQSDTLKQKAWVDSIMNRMTLREKIGQLFMVAAFSNKDQKHIDEITALVKNEKIGGLCFFQGGPIRQALLTNKYQALSRVPLLISIDAEWGLAMRLDSTFSYPRQMMLGAASDPNLVYQMGSDIAHQCKRMGIHIDFAPVVDINSNPLNPVISTRSFGEDKEMITQNGIAYMKGLQDNGILACAKHFPGHGDTDADSHLSLPRVNHSIERLDSVEFFPFKELIKNGLTGVMVAHLRVPALEKDSTLPSSLSPNVIKKILIDSLKYKGLIYTDALNMKGAALLHLPVETNYLALKAGNDILLYAEKVKETIDFIESEVKKGSYPIEEINFKCRKILNTKYAAGLSKYQPVDTTNLVADLNRPYSELLKRKIVEKGITVLNNNGLIPVQRLDTLNIAYIEFGKGKGTTFRDQLELYAPITSFSIDPESSINAYDSLLTSLDKFNLIIVGYHSADTRPSKNYGIPLLASNFLFDLSFRKKVILDIFGNPYTLSKFLFTPSIEGLIVSFDNSITTQSLSAQMIFGGIGSNGKLPVSATKRISLGSGHQNSDRIRLKYSIPEELGIDSKDLAGIDSIAKDAIAQQITPGMQILAAKDGVVFYNKSFGSFTYSNENPVTVKSIYDIASVTKITATLPIVMHLYEKDSLDLQKSLENYISLPNGCNKKKLIIKDLLLHQAGLQSWIPFYVSTLSTLYPEKTATSTKYSPEYPFQFSDNVYIHKHSIPSPKYYSKSYSFEFPLQVAENIFAREGIKDTIFNRMNSSELKDAGKFKYSDLGFLYLQRVVENITNKGIDEYVDNTFYKHLGMSSTSFQSLKKFDRTRIVPTEEDVTFRKQLISGYVHDPTAAMMGGIAGHAGVFSTTNDLAKLMQMFLQKGIYGGERFLSENTVDLFTTSPKGNNGNRRALGFDKPEAKGRPSPACESASALSFGHSGFTGTMVWADPKNGLVYVFLSNRVYPDATNNRLAEMNIRTNIQEIFYKAISKVVR